MAWQKGQSGNPGGRPRADVQVRELARAHTAAALKALVTALQSKNERTRVAAAEALLDRGWGRPGQAVTGERDEGPAEMVIRWQTGLQDNRRP